MNSRIALLLLIPAALMAGCQSAPTKRCVLVEAAVAYPAAPDGLLTRREVLKRMRSGAAVPWRAPSANPQSTTDRRIEARSGISRRLDRLRRVASDGASGAARAPVG